MSDLTLQKLYCHNYLLMLETPHAAVGAALVLAIPNPLISLPLAFASHFVLDIVPHYNPHIHTELKKYGKLQKKTVGLIVVDSTVAAVLGFSIAWFAAYSNPDIFSTSTFFLVLLGAFMGTLGDFLEMPFYFLKYRGKLMQKYVMWQKGIQNHIDNVWGILTQIVVLIAAVWWIWQII